ncbi:hypothetical protein ADUPG1_000499, partial [Aduncisulcus paluster]
MTDMTVRVSTLELTLAWLFWVGTQRLEDDQVYQSLLLPWLKVVDPTAHFHEIGIVEKTRDRAIESWTYSNCQKRYYFGGKKKGKVSPLFWDQHFISFFPIASFSFEKPISSRDHVHNAHPQTRWRPKLYDTPSVSSSLPKLSASPVSPHIFQITRFCELVTHIISIWMCDVPYLYPSLFSIVTKEKKRFKDCEKSTKKSEKELVDTAKHSPAPSLSHMHNLQFICQSILAPASVPSLPLPVSHKLDKMSAQRRKREEIESEHGYEADVLLTGGGLGLACLASKDMQKRGDVSTSKEFPDLSCSTRVLSKRVTFSDIPHESRVSESYVSSYSRSSAAFTGLPRDILPDTPFSLDAPSDTLHAVALYRVSSLPKIHSSSPLLSLPYMELLHSMPRRFSVIPPVIFILLPKLISFIQTHLCVQHFMDRLGAVYLLLNLWSS